MQIILPFKKRHVICIADENEVKKYKMKKQLIILFFIATTYRSFGTDYSNQQNWAALPTMKDNADWTPNGLTNKQDSAQVDVFFIHPTTDVTGFKGNANIDNKAINNQTDDFPIKYQASVFNESCKVYAPRYRQAALHNFFTKNNETSQKAFDIAYQDIKAAFEYYLKNYNNQFQDLKISEKADTFGGYISYSTFGMDSKIISVVPEYNNAVSVNPLDWTTNKEFVSSQENKGSLTKKSNELVKHLFGAKNGNGIVEIQKPGEGFVPMTMKNYHIYDYSLFYINIRENVALRIKKYFEYNKIK